VKFSEIGPSSCVLSTFTVEGNSVDDFDVSSITTGRPVVEGLKSISSLTRLGVETSVSSENVSVVNNRVDELANGVVCSIVSSVVLVSSDVAEEEEAGFAVPTDSMGSVTSILESAIVVFDASAALVEAETVVVSLIEDF